MRKVAKFEKVSYEQFEKDVEKFLHNTQGDNTDWIKQAYDAIKLPTRATTGSAGYDFYSPFNISMQSNTEIVIPTGVRTHFFNPDWFLAAYPRSGLGFKQDVVLANTVGIIDSDYYFAENEGHILIKLRYKGKIGTTNLLHTPVRFDGFETVNIITQFDLGSVEVSTLSITAGDRFVQGILTPYGCTIDDDATEDRTGGTGSTGA